MPSRTGCLTRQAARSPISKDMVLTEMPLQERTGFEEAPCPGRVGQETIVVQDITQR